MSIWINTHKTGRGIQKESISNRVSSPLCWQSACDLKKNKIKNKKAGRERSYMPLSIINLKERHQELVCDQNFLKQVH